MNIHIFPAVDHTIVQSHVYDLKAYLLLYFIGNNVLYDELRWVNN